MFTQPHNQTLLNDVMKILGGGDKPENNIKPAPQWVIDASRGAAQSLTEAYKSGEVITSETKRDILRKHLAEAVKNCGCGVTKEDPIYFEKEVEKRMNEGIVSTDKLATPKVVAQKTAKPPTKSIPVNKGLGSQKEQIVADMRYFLEQLTREEVEVLTDVVLEATMTKKQLEKAVNDTFYKHFNKVQIDMMSIPRLYKEIEAGLSAGKSPDDFVPDLVKKYRKN
jgi:hypothetical protein